MFFSRKGWPGAGGVADLEEGMVCFSADDVGGKHGRRCCVASELRVVGIGAICVFLEDQ